MRSYIRTEAGTAAVTNPRVFLPTRLRALLAALDGPADPLQGMGALGPAEVRLMLESLCKAGYVVEVAAGGQSAANDSRPVPLSAFGGAPAPAAVGLPPAAAALPTDPRALLARMNDFIMTHLPQDALDVLFALEGLDTLDQLRDAFNAYAVRIHHLGAPAREHLAELRAALGLPAGGLRAASFPTHPSHS